MSKTPHGCKNRGLNDGKFHVLGQPSQWVSLSSGDLTAEVDPVGAQLSTLRDRTGRDLLWDGDPSVWTGRAPLLFPIVGTLAGGGYRLGSKSYHLPRHGFARGKLFDVVETTSASVVLRLKADEASIQVYPFRFELDVQFALDGPTLSVTTCVRNAGAEDMPASFGYHPAFRWPLPFGRARSAHFIEFESDEPAPIRRLDADGLLSAERYQTPIVQRRLALADALFQDDVIIFDEIRSRSVTYGADDGPRLRVSYPDAPYLGLWTKPRANFICIEPWHGVADPAGFSQDFRVKPGVAMVAPGAALPIKMAITLIEA
jgi:galactose mutarotase-like enzyme